LLLAGLVSFQSLRGQTARPTPATAPEATAAANKAQPATPPTAPDRARHSLWKVQGKKNTVYLLGSVHFLKETDYPLPMAIETAFNDSKVVVFETDIGKMEEPEAQLKLLSKATLPEGETLNSQLSAETYKELTRRLDASGLPELRYGRLKPAMAAMVLEVTVKQGMGFDPAIDVDKHFYDLARKARKTTQGLETLDFRIALATEFTREEGEAMVKSTLKQMDKAKTELATIMKAWRTGDAEGLGKILNEGTLEAPALFKRLFTDRNQRWVPKIEELTRGEENALVIVGAGHLPGKEGVLELLKKQGLKITQL
jgi:uncharacterized protein YbaP (TraB family)